MVNLPSHCIEHGVDTRITSPRFFGKIFGSDGAAGAPPREPHLAAKIVSHWLEPAPPPDSGPSEQGVLRQHAAHPLVVQGDTADPLAPPHRGPLRFPGGGATARSESSSLIPKRTVMSVSGHRCALAYRSTLPPGAAAAALAAG